MTRTVDLFRGRLHVDDFCATESDWAFQVFDDQTLHVEICRPANWRERHAKGGDETASLEAELAYSYICYGGVATPISIRARVDRVDTVPACDYICSFYLAKCGAEGESWTVQFEGTLSPTQGFRGQWEHKAHQEYRFWRDDLSDGVQRIIPVGSEWHSNVEDASMFLSPLTRGTYSLRGSLRLEENGGFIVPFALEIELLSDGELVGSSAPVGGKNPTNGDQVAELSGSWTRNSLEILQVYRFADSPNEAFAFQGEVNRYSITGRWVVSELEALGEWEDSEQQLFHLQLTKMCRPWHAAEHKFFPDTFRAVVRLCLLWSIRSDAQTIRLPSALWPQVLCFCDSQWFNLSSFVSEAIWHIYCEQ